jgi:hypothetical protein
VLAKTYNQNYNNFSNFLFSCRILCGASTFSFISSRFLPPSV